MSDTPREKYEINAAYETPDFSGILGGLNISDNQPERFTRDYYDDPSLTPLEIKEQVELAIEAASQNPEDAELWTPRLLLEIPDHDLDLVRIDNPTDLLPDFVIVTESKEEYKQILVETVMASDCGPETLARLFEHEDDHAQTQQSLDPESTVQQGIKISPSKSGSRFDVLAFQLPDNLTVSKLGLAAIVANPERPSSGDILTLQDLGYTDSGDLINRFKRHNAIGSLGPEIPMPKWHK
jgi:hypothetical protein